MTKAATLAGKRILVTGAAGGLGRAVAAQLAEGGARLLLADRDAAQLTDLAASLAGDAAMVAADLATPAGNAEMFAALDRELGGIDVLVACTGLGAGPLCEMTEPDWKLVLDANLASYLHATQGALQRMMAEGRRDGQIILVGSISVHIKAVGESVYNAAKGGVASFAETLRKELIPHGIRVTLVEPGAISSPMQPFTADERAAQVDRFELLPPDEVAEAILFAATRRPGVDVVTLRIEPLAQKIC